MKYNLNKKAKEELKRMGITKEKGILLYQNKLSLGYINGKKIETAIAETKSKTGSQEWKIIK